MRDIETRVVENLDRSENIDTSKLTAEKEKLEKKKEELKEMFEKIKVDTNELKNHWETKTSESVFTNFEDLYKEFDTIIENFENDIDFLGKVIEGYNALEEQIGKDIDEKIATS